MKKRLILTAAILTAAALSGCGSNAADNTAQTLAETTAESTEAQSAAETAELTGRGQGFGGEIIAHVTVENDVITGVVFEGGDETPGIGAAALEALAVQVVEANGADIDGVAGATVTTEGCKAAVLNALDPEANPYEEPEAPAADNAAAPEPVTFPDDKKILSAVTYGIYTKKEDSPQDAVMKTTLYWNETDKEVYDIRFLQAMLPWDDNGATGGWANVTDEAVLEALGDAVISFTANVYGNEVECSYAKYIQIGGIVWTGELGSDPACEQAVVYSAEIDGHQTLLNDYVASEDGGKWYHEAALQNAYLLTSDEAASSSDDGQVAGTVEITYKETNGHGEAHWNSDLKFSGNMEAIKEFVKDNGFVYEYYADGGFSQNDDGYWETVDAVTGATLDEAPSYFDALKRLYEKILSGEYTEEN